MLRMHGSAEGPAADKQLQPERSILNLLEKGAGMNIWLYTGYTWEQIMEGKAGEAAKEVLPYIDVLVDGPFIEALLTEDAIWRGSSNQRLIDVQERLNGGEKHD